MRKKRQKTLKDALKETIGAKLKDKPIVVWYDAEGSFRDMIQELKISDAKFLVFDGSYLEIRVKIEEEDPGLQGKWLIYVPEGPSRPSWLRDYELAGGQLELSLPELYSRFWGTPLFDRDIENLLKGKRGRLLASRWDELFLDTVTISKENIETALLYTTLEIPIDSGPEKIIGTVLERQDVWEKLEDLGLTETLKHYVQKQLGLEIFREKEYVINLSQALFLSELVECSKVDVKTYENAFPDRRYRKRWAEWLREWLKVGDRKRIEELAKKTESDYDLKSRLTGWDIADIQGIPCVDDILLEEIKVLTEGKELNLSLIKDIAEKRKQALWKRPTWEAILRAINVLENSEKVIAELNSKKGWNLNEVFHNYKDRWYRLDEDYLMLEIEENDLPSWMKDKLAKRAHGAYREYLDTLGEKAGEALQNEKVWKIKGWKPQTEVLRSVLDLEKKDFVLILVDALRMGLAKKLQEMLKKDYIVEESPTLASLPSITPVGMGSLIPLDVSLSIEIEKDQLKFRRDQVDVKLIRKRNNLWHKVLPYAKIMNLDEIEDSELKTCVEPIIVCSQEVDKDEETLSRLKADTFAMILERLCKVIRRILEAGYSMVIVAADHGFLWIPRGQAFQTLTVSRGEEVVVERRYAIGKPENVPNTVRFTLSDVGIQGEGNIVFPRGLKIFSKQGPVSAFLHGGYMPQESALITLVIKRKAEKKGIKVTIEKKIIDTLIPIFTIKCEHSKGYVKPRTVQVMAFYKGKKIGASEEITIEMADEEKRTKPVRLTEPGPEVQVKVMDIHTKEILNEKTFEVVLPRREDIL